MVWAIFSGCSGRSRSYPFSAVCFPVGGLTSPTSRPVPSFNQQPSPSPCSPQNSASQKALEKYTLLLLLTPQLALQLALPLFLELRWNFWDKIEIDFYSYVNFSVSHISKFWECFREDVTKKTAVLLDFFSKYGGGPCPNLLSPFHYCIFGQ